jgi:hypothetical protein
LEYGGKDHWQRIAFWNFSTRMLLYFCAGITTKETEVKHMRLAGMRLRVWKITLFKRAKKAAVLEPNYLPGNLHRYKEFATFVLRQDVDFIPTLIAPENYTPPQYNYAYNLLRKSFENEEIQEFLGIIREAYPVYGKITIGSHEVSRAQDTDIIS